MNHVFFLCLTPLVGALLLFPAWWAAGRLQDDGTSPFFRLMCAAGLALVAYIAGVNLLGRLFGNSFAAVAIYLALNAIASVRLWRDRPREEFRADALVSGWRSWIGPVLIALALGLPQWLVAVSTPFWDEVAASAVSLTSPNQFAEGVFPPRHNALPDVAIKYHYGFSILSGTLKRLLGVSANVAIDLASTGLWLFTFLFCYFWLRALEFDGLEALWGAFATLLGGGLAWLYLPSIEAYNGIEKVPTSGLLHRYEPAKSWIGNLVAAAVSPNQNLRNADGSLSSLPWDIAAQFQQHAVSLGIAMALVALYLFTTWQKRRDLRRTLLAVNIVVFSVVFLGHAVFGTVAAFAAGIYLLQAWARNPSRERFMEGLLFGAGVSVLGLLHGGMLAMGAQYGGGGFLTLRRELGYSAGGLIGFLNWNIAGFGIPLALTILALCLHHRFRGRGAKAAERDILFAVLAVFGVFSYLVPQFSFYSSETYGVEQYTEISKFFFSAHFAMALLSVYGVAWLRRFPWRRWVMIPCFLAAAVSPVLFCYKNSVDDNGSLLGFYHAPYHPGSIEEQMGNALRRLKKTNHDVYFDASADERHHGYLSEMLVFGGSVFTLTPSAYERTGIGFRLSQDVVARRFAQNSRMARLLPGAAEAAGVSWYYCRSLVDQALAPLIVRSRFAKLVAEGAFVKKFEAGLRVLYAIEKPTADLDQGIEKYWTPTVVTQTRSDCAGDGKNDLVFYDYADKKIVCGKTQFDLPEWLRGEFVNVSVAKFPGKPRAGFMVGRMKDTRFQLGKRIEENVEYDAWGWSYRDPNTDYWRPEWEHWLWDGDIPLIADLDHSGFSRQLAYRLSNGQWLSDTDQVLPGPKADKSLLPIPFAGRFLDGSKGDLGLWTLMNGMVTLKSVDTGKSVSFRWGGTYGFILVPGDYDGAGRDQIGIFNRSDLTWYWHRVPDGPVSSGKFGTPTGIPVPWDYNHDGRLDLAYWEPSEGKIYVSFNHGKSVGLIVPVPPHSIPAFVNMY